MIHCHCSAALKAGVPRVVKLRAELQCCNIMQTVWRALIIDPLSVSEGRSRGEIQITTSEKYIGQSHKKLHLQYEVKRHLTRPKG